ncbi:MAG TPA: hypothetical protein VNB23_01215 [Ramlibacter sp.]|nr:hypothetical protein [Ramlibacter sp.]
MKTNKLALAVASLAAASVFAQAILGTVTSVEGVATVTTGTTGTAISAGAPIVNGARVITTSTGSVTFRLANGCTITVPPGHAVTVQSNLSCEQLRAAMRPVVTTTATTTTTTTVPGGPFFGVAPGATAAIAAGLIIAVVVANQDDDDEPLSAR